MPDDEEASGRSDAQARDVVFGDRRLSRPDTSLPDWEVPDSAYRPVPIVWFTAALIAQQIALGAVFAAIPAGSNRIAIALAALLSAMIGRWTWERGMGSASLGWRTAMLVVLVGQFALVALAIAARD